MNPIATAQYGMMAASRRFETSAGKVARMDDDLDLGGEIIEQIQARHALSANAGVLRAADEMYGDLLDVLA